MSSKAYSAGDAFKHGASGHHQASKWQVERPKSELESSMSGVQIEQKSYEMPPREGISIAHVLTVADIERSARYYEKSSALGF